MSQRASSAKRWSDRSDSSTQNKASNLVEPIRPIDDASRERTIKTAHPRTSFAQNDLAISYSQRDIETIRSQIIEGESLKRRWLVVGLVISSVALAISLALLSSSYALYAQSEAENEQLSLQHAAISQRAEALQQQLDTRIAQDAARDRSISEASQTVEGLISSTGALPSSGGRFAKAVYQMGGRFETRSKPPDALFRNWKVASESGSEIYTVVGGFVDGNWQIYSNLIGRRTSD
jgi:hypothetical protein